MRAPLVPHEGVDFVDDYGLDAGELLAAAGRGEQ